MIDLSISSGKGEVIRGWDIGVGTMKIGEKANLFIKVSICTGAATGFHPGGGARIFGT